MRFDKVKPKQVWPAQKVYQRISLVERDIANFNRFMNRIDGQMKNLLESKKTIKRKITHKWKYLKQLKEQLKEVLV